MSRLSWLLQSWSASFDTVFTLVGASSGVQAKGWDVAESGARHGVIQWAVGTCEGGQGLSAVCQAPGRLRACQASTSAVCLPGVWESS
jgi:hypothetical protein